MGNPAHRRGGRRGVSGTLVVAVLVAFGLGWLGAVLVASARPTHGAAGDAARSAAPSTALSTAPPANPSSPVPTSAGGVVPVGFDEPAVSSTGLAVTALVTKIKGGVVLTFVAQNRGSQPITVSTGNLGPGAIRFRGAQVPMQMAHETKKLVPGEALVYPCTVRLPDMSPGEMSFTVAGLAISGQAAGD